ncbi:putative phage abortive infection protein [Flagellimonas oceanensis]|uniref:putative phage abortive infection protein n=1 Tax=Flagellimonas oceanensis TaxID=2499163 RepID=UPI000F8D211F|nr:putative phage abortive infection protein [Allomuricauda oceanensis]
MDTKGASNENRDEKKKDEDLNKYSKIAITVAIGLFVFSFVAPILLTQWSIIDLSPYGGIGDAMGGIMNPFIAASGVITTFLAFLMQVRANEQQRVLFNRQIKEERERFQQELNVQQKQDKEAAVEQRFYEMLRLHKENVSEISFEVRPINEVPYEIVGRKVFVEMLKELKVIYAIVKNYFPEQDKNFHVDLAYSYFFQGIGPQDSGDTYTYSTSPSSDNYSKAVKAIIQINIIHNNRGSQSGGLQGIEVHTGNRIKDLPDCRLGYGHSSQLGYYYRHLFQTVKYVANQDEGLLTYEEKRSFLRTLRAQLSNEEQAMLFINSKSKFGKKWNSDENRFLTDYRMIHNLSNHLLPYDFDLAEEFQLDQKPMYMKEKGREDDYLFDFEENQRRSN